MRSLVQLTDVQFQKDNRSVGSKVSSNDKSAAERAHTIICDQILDGTLKPGQRITRREMAELTQVSIIPVIEAIHRLENDGLVESTRNVGSRVVSLNAETRFDRYALRLAVENQVARILGSGRLRAEVKQKLLDQAEHLDADIEQNGRSRQTWENHYQFHLDLVLYSECPSLVAAHKRNHYFLLLEWRELSHWDQSSDSDAEAYSHVWLLNEIFSRDPHRAQLASSRHIASSEGFPPNLRTWDGAE